MGGDDGRRETVEGLEEMVASSESDEGNVRRKRYAESDNESDDYYDEMGSEEEKEAKK